MKWLLVLSMFHNLKLQKASLIMITIEKDSPVDSKTEKPEFSLLLVPEPPWCSATSSKPGAI